MIMGIEVWKVLAASYERSAVSLREQSEAHSRAGFNRTADALLAAAYNAETLRAGALDVVDKLKGNE